MIRAGCGRGAIGILFGRGRHIRVRPGFAIPVGRSRGRGAIGIFRRGRDWGEIRERLDLEGARRIGERYRRYIPYTETDRIIALSVWRYRYRVGSHSPGKGGRVGNERSAWRGALAGRAVHRLKGQVVIFVRAQSCDKRGGQYLIVARVGRGVGDKIPIRRIDPAGLPGMWLYQRYRMKFEIFIS